MKSLVPRCSVAWGASVVWLVALGGVPATGAPPSGIQLDSSPLGAPLMLVPVAERDGVVYLEAATAATSALPQPYCSADAGVNQCLVARCNSGSCGFPALLDDSHDVGLSIVVEESDLVGFFGTANCTARDINVGLDIDHTWVSDVEASVRSFDGDVNPEFVIGYLLENSPSCSGDNLELVFDDSSGTAAPACLAGTPAYQGTVRPHDQSAFLNVAIPAGTSTGIAGVIPSRTWKILIEDSQAQDSGYVQDVWIAWGLECSTGGGGDCSISVSPSQPTTATVPIYFTVSGNWGTSCLPSFDNGTIDTVNRVIRINATSNASCLNCNSVVTPFTIGVQTSEPLAAGTWQVQFWARECSNPYSQRCGQSFQVTQAAGSGCTPGQTTLCIDDNPGDRRFKVEVSYSTVQGGGLSGPGRAIALNSLGVTRGGLFWFFSADNPEMLVKVLNGCPVNSRRWIYLTAGTNVGYVVTITDTVTGAYRQYTNTDGVAAQPVQDVNGLVCN